MLCAECRARIRADRPTCTVCGEYAPTGRTCYGCLPATPLAGSVAVGPYEDPVLRSAIKRLKFTGIRSLAQPLAELLARRIVARNLLPAILVPLPLHPRRERARGFNQARLLADAAGELLGLPVEHLLIRTRQTSPQTSILGSPRQRRRNVAGAFALRASPRSETPTLSKRPRTILLDDVLTTGASLTEAGSVLRAAGVEEIWAAVVARG